MLVRARPFIDTSELKEVIASNSDKEDIALFASTFSQKLELGECVATHRGRDAFALALKIIEIKPGDEIIVPDFICEVVIDIILNFGAIPVVIDNSLSDFNCPVENYEKAITMKTRALLVLHLYGIPARVDALRQLADHHGLYLIEDCAQTSSSKYLGKNVGTSGHISFFSFNFDKPISLGLGGMLAVNDEALQVSAMATLRTAPRSMDHQDKEILRALFLQHFLTSDERYRSFLPISFAQDVLKLLPKLSRTIDSAMDSGNTKALFSIASRASALKLRLKIQRRFSKQRTGNVTAPLLMGGIRAKLGLLQLEHLNSIDQKRRHAAKVYQNIFSEHAGYQPPPNPKNSDIIFSRFTILTRNSTVREKIIKAAFRAGIELDFNNWRKTISSAAAYKAHVRKGDPSLNISESFSQRILHIPTHYYVTEKHLHIIQELFHYLDDQPK